MALGSQTMGISFCVDELGNPHCYFGHANNTFDPLDEESLPLASFIPYTNGQAIYPVDSGNVLPQCF